MSIKKNVFASKAERQNYYKLSCTWGDNYRIFHNLPFLNLFETKDLPFKLNDLEIARLKKTSIDYILCNKQDCPVICIEFDGLQEGYNIGTEYHQDLLPESNPWREEITELKLKVAHASLFPYFVVGSKYFDDITTKVKLTIVDGIIGTILSNQATHARFAQGFDPIELGYSREEFDDLPEWDQHEMIQDWVTGVEVHADMENNPVSRKSAQLHRSSKITSWGCAYLSSPNPDTAKTFEERAKLIEKSIRKGCKVTLHTHDCGDVVAEAWLPEFKIVGYYGWGLCENIATILAIDKLERIRANKH